MKTLVTISKLVIAVALTTIILATIVRAAPIAPTTATLAFRVLPDPATMGGMSTNDFGTNFVLEIRASGDCTVPTNLWQPVFSQPMTNYYNQGPMGTEWTQQVPVIANPTFFIARATNNLGGTGPFTGVATWLAGAPPGTLRATH